MLGSTPSCGEYAGRFSVEEWWAQAGENHRAVGLGKSKPPAIRLRADSSEAFTAV